MSTDISPPRPNGRRSGCPPFRSDAAANVPDGSTRLVGEQLSPHAVATSMIGLDTLPRTGMADVDRRADHVTCLERTPAP